MTAALVARISLSNLRANLQLAIKRAPLSRIMAIVKANGYGHGAVEVAKSLSLADAFGVARLEEALELRAAGIDKTIVLLEGVYSGRDVITAQSERLQAVMHCPEQLELAANVLKSPAPNPLQVWLKLETGMNRLGLSEAAFKEVHLAVLSDKRFELVGLMSHMACAEQADHPMNTRQIDKFEQLTGEYATPRSLANSAGLMNFQASHFDWVRPGIMLYGTSLLRDTNELLSPVMTLSSHLVHVRLVKQGETVGYGADCQMQKDTRIGLVAIGYGDGYPTDSAGTPVLINGHECPVVGPVSMDLLCVELGSTPARVGDPVTLWGEGLPVDRVAEYVGTIPYVLVTGLTRRVGFKYEE